MTPLRQAPAIMQAHETYRTIGKHRTERTPELLVTPSVIHAAVVPAPGPKSPWFQVRLGRFWRWHAMCGARIAAVTADYFDEDAPQACAKCSEQIDILYHTDRELDWSDFFDNN